LASGKSALIPSLERGTAKPPTAPRSTALLHTLAALLLEALGRDDVDAGMREGAGEPEDHA
jgi:hypothetical protein